MIIARKKIVISILAMVCMHSLRATTSPGESIWQMVKDVGVQTDTIATLAAGSGGGVGCTTTITQADLTAATYTISQPGLYCLAENATSSQNPIITINSSNVVLDLQHYTLTGNTLNEGIITDASTKNHVAIQNGNIRLCDTGIRIPTGIDVLLIENMQIFNSINYVLQIGQVGGLISNILINNCYFLFDGNLGINLRGDTVQQNNVVFTNCYLNNLSSGVTINGITNFFMSDCYFYSSYFDASLCKNIFLNNTIVSNSLSISLQVGQRNTIHNWLILGAGLAFADDGLVFNQGTSGIAEHCVTLNGTGRGIVASGSTTNLLFRECISMNNASSGMSVSLTSVNPQLYANISRGNTTNYSNVTVAPVVTTPTAATSYWANVN